MSTPAPAHNIRRRAWGWLGWVFLIALTLVSAGKFLWKINMRYRAADELRAAGFYPGREDVWQVARADWHGLLKRETWHVEPEVHWVGLAGTPSVHNLAGIAPALRRLGTEVIYIRGCRDLLNMDGLTDLPALKTVTLSDCYALKNVDGLKGLTALENLGLEDCVALKDVDSLRGLTALKRITIAGCSRLSVDSIDALRAALPKATVIDPGIRPTARIREDPAR